MSDDELRDLIDRLSEVAGGRAEPGTPEAFAKVVARYGSIPEQAAALHRVAARGRIGGYRLLSDWADPAAELSLLSELHADNYLRGEDPYGEIGLIDPENEVLFFGDNQYEIVGVDLRRDHRGELLSFTTGSSGAPPVFTVAKDLISFLRYLEVKSSQDYTPRVDDDARALADKYGVSHFHLM